MEPSYREPTPEPQKTEEEWDAELSDCDEMFPAKGRDSNWTFGWHGCLSKQINQMLLSNWGLVNFSFSALRHHKEC